MKTWLNTLCQGNRLASMDMERVLGYHHNVANFSKNGNVFKTGSLFLTAGSGLLVLVVN